MKQRTKKSISFLTALLLTASCLPNTISFADTSENDNSIVSVQDAGYIFSFDKIQVSYNDLKTVKDYQGAYEGQVLEGGTYLLDQSKADKKVAEVKLNIDKNSGINTGALRFDYDNSNGMEFIGILYSDMENKKLTSTDAQIKLAKPSSKKILVSNSNKDSVDTGLLATLLFIVPDTFDEGQKFSLEILDTTKMYSKNDASLSTYGNSGYIEMYAKDIPAEPAETTTPEETTAETTTTPEETTAETTTTPEETTVVTTTTPKETTKVTTTTPKETTVVTTTTPKETTVITTTTEVVSETEKTEQKILKIKPEDITYDFSDGAEKLEIGIDLKGNNGVCAVSADVKIEGLDGSFEIVNGDFSGTFDGKKDGSRFIFTSPDGKNINAEDKKIAYIKIDLNKDLVQGEYKIVLSNVTVSRYNSNTGKIEEIDTDNVKVENGLLKITGEKVQNTTASETTVTTEATVTTVTTVTTEKTTTKVTTEETTAFDADEYFAKYSAVKFSVEDIKMKKSNMGLEAVIRIDGDLPIAGFMCDVKISDEKLKVASLSAETVDFDGDISINKKNNRIQFTSDDAYNVEAASGKLVKLNYTFENALEEGVYSIELSNISAATYIEGMPVTQKLLPVEKIASDTEATKFEVTPYVPDIKIVQMPNKRFYTSFDSKFDLSGMKVTVNDKDVTELLEVKTIPSELYNAKSETVLYEVPILFNGQQITTVPMFIGVLGDINSDGSVNAEDATYILKQINDKTLREMNIVEGDMEFEKLYSKAIEKKIIPDTVAKEDFVKFLCNIGDTYVDDSLKEDDYSLRIDAADASMILRFFNQLTNNEFAGIKKDDKTVWEELKPKK